MAFERINISYCAMLIALFPFIIFILSAVNIKVTPISIILNELTTSLNDYPLSEFHYLSSCQTSQYVNNIYTFPGHQTGCSCVEIEHYPYGKKGKNIVSKGYCNINQTLNGCSDLSSLQSQNLSTWKNGRFCSRKYDDSLQTFKGYLHFLNSSVLENEECQEGYKKCGLLDDMKNYLCFPINYDCPINDIKISNYKNTELEKKGYSYSYNNRVYIYYINTSNNSVIVKMKAAEGKICMDRSRYHTDYPQYILDNNFKNYGCKHKIDEKLYENFEILDTRKKGDFYLDSGLNLNKSLKYYHQFPFNSLEANMVLYPQRYIGFNKKCLIDNGAFDKDNSPFNEDNLKEIDKRVGKTISISKIVIWFAAVSFIVELITSTLLVSEEDCQYITIWTVINLVCYIFISVPFYINLYHVKVFKKLPLCAGKIINIKFRIYNSTLSTLKINTILSVVLVNCIIAFNIIIIILKCIIPNNIRYNNINIDYNRPEEQLINKPPETQYNNEPELPLFNKPPETQYNNEPELPYYNNNQQNNTESAIDNLKPQYSNY